MGCSVFLSYLLRVSADGAHFADHLHHASAPADCEREESGVHSRGELHKRFFEDRLRLEEED
eukprot:scaffold216096_cov36-Tisochrysis_lutea.AAC.1